jgi:hypothetical protein
LGRNPAFSGKRNRISDDQVAHAVGLDIRFDLCQIGAQIRALDRSKRQRKTLRRIRNRKPDALGADVQCEDRYDAAFGFLPK